VGKLAGLKIQAVTSRKDARAMDALDIAVWGSDDPEHHRFFEDFLDSGMRIYRVMAGAKLAGALVTGYPTSANLMEVEELMVAHEYRGKGIGMKCLEFARKEARRRGHEGIVVEVDLKNRHAYEWYGHRGMKVVGHVMVDNEKAWIKEERVIKAAKTGK